MSTQIPARIIQTGKSRDLPMLARAAVANMKALNPEFEWTFFDDQGVADFIHREFPQHRRIFENFPYRIQKYDFFRYLAVYRLGGFYFDLDVFLARGIGELRSNACVLAFEELTLNRHLRENCGMDWEVGNYAFAAAPGNPYLEAVIENCVRAQRDPEWVRPMMRGIPKMFQPDFTVLNTTGPGLMTRTLAENPSLAAEVTVLFPADVCDETTWHHFGDFGIHAMEGSWRTKGNRFRRWSGRYWENRLRNTQMTQSRELGKSRVFPASRGPAGGRVDSLTVSRALADRPAGTMVP